MKRCKDVFILVMIRTMYHRQTVRVGGPGGQLGDIRRVVGVEMLARPKCGNLRNGIEFRHVGQARHNLVMIATDDEWTERLDPLGHLVRIRPVIDNIPQAQDALPTSFDGCERSLECSGIRVNIAQDQKSHEWGTFTGRV